MSMKSCGLSRQKVSYLKSLSEAFLKKKIIPRNWSKLSDEEIKASLDKLQTPTIP